MMWLPYVIFREMYLLQLQSLVFALSDSTTFMRHRGDGVNAIPSFAGC